ncbi:MAG: YggS family pyridoxal phosphate-dependent enzyme [Bacteroidota bacterium]|nr:MAG: YggS family pyridoxal phosphate-dependent enzyme [Bacteroidota bacterium]
MGIVGENLVKIKNELSREVVLVAVSKTKPNADIMDAYQTGHRVFGENKVQELVKKYEELPKDIEWHFIGHLQTNKVKYLAPFISMIHAVDSLKLLSTIHSEALKNNRVIPCLLQCKIAVEDTKYGMAPEDIHNLLRSESFAEIKAARIVGMMGMATFTDNLDQVKKEFSGLSALFRALKSAYFFDDKDFTVLSMGMSHDYQVALREGSNMIRIGSSIFGERNYNNSTE